MDKLRNKKQKQARSGKFPNFNESQLKAMRAHIWDDSVVLNQKLNIKELGDLCRGTKIAFEACAEALSLPPDSKTAFLASVADQVKVYSDVQAWEAEAKELLRIVGNADWGSINQIEAHMRSNPPSAGAITILVIEAAERERARALEEKNKRFAPIREEGTKKKIEDGRKLRDDIVKMNADLLAKPASEGWGSKKKRADYISKRIGKSFSYISRIIAIPRKINQT